MEGQLLTDSGYYKIYYEWNPRYKVRDIEIACNSTIQRIPFIMEWENFCFKCDKVIKEYLLYDRKNIFCLITKDTYFWLDESVCTASFSVINENVFEYEICFSRPFLSNNLSVLKKVEDNIKNKTILRRFKKK